MDKFEVCVWEPGAPSLRIVYRGEVAYKDPLGVLAKDGTELCLGPRFAGYVVLRKVS